MSHSLKPSLTTTGDFQENLKNKALCDFRSFTSYAAIADNSSMNMQTGTKEDCAGQTHCRFKMMQAA